MWLSLAKNTQTVQSNSLNSVLGYLVSKECKYIGGKVSTPFHVQQRIKVLFDGIKRIPILKKPRIGTLEVGKSQPWAFFNRACQGRPGICRAGEVIYLSCAHKISLGAGLGEGSSNTIEIGKRTRHLSRPGDGHLKICHRLGKRFLWYTESYLETPVRSCQITGIVVLSHPI
jgi:hypothetical protein